MAGALDGLVVVDLTSHLSGPYAAMMLADHGADVLKIERPEAGDDARRMPPFIEGESAPFMVWNRNKRSVELDLKSVEGKARLLELVDGADILIENMRPGVMDKLGLGYATLSKRNPRLIYAAISGFGQTGPYASRGGFDLIAQGMSGLISTNGPAEGPPYRLPIAISDVAAGMFLAFGILAAVEVAPQVGTRTDGRDVASGGGDLVRRLRGRALLDASDATRQDRPDAPWQCAVSMPRGG